MSFSSNSCKTNDYTTEQEYRRSRHQFHNLYAQRVHTHKGWAWSVIDPSGASWVPNEELEVELARSHWPENAILHACLLEPERGEWTS